MALDLGSHHPGLDLAEHGLAFCAAQAERYIVSIKHIHIFLFVICYAHGSGFHTPETRSYR
jgi:hypothetical protein